MSNRRLARARKRPSYEITGTADDPNRNTVHRLEHPRYGTVVVRRRGNRMTLIKWSNHEGRQNWAVPRTELFNTMCDELGL